MPFPASLPPPTGFSTATADNATEAIYIFVLASVNRGALPQIEDTAASQFVVPLSEKMGTGFI